jgi:S-adenosylmethionine synthetase
MPIFHCVTSESVCAGHPDKICDQISDAIVDAVLAVDPVGHVAVETLVTTNQVVLAGEVRTSAKIDFVNIARNQIERLGYVIPELHFSSHAQVKVLIHEQSPEIAVGVDAQGAGDQGMMFGFACQETPELMPLPIVLAHHLARRIDEVREKMIVPHLRPDGKTQVTIRYEGDRPVTVEKVILAVPHAPDTKVRTIAHDLYEAVIVPVLDEYGFSVPVKDVVVNGTGVWHIGGPASDTGLTGRKIVVDGYGGYARVGGGCFSGKDPTKVDRSGAYAARFLAKNIVAHGLATRAEVGLAYCIGQQQPVMKSIETFGTARVTGKEIQKYVDSILDCSVSGIIRELEMRQPIYLATAAYGHFGRSEFPWEKA